MRVKTSKHLKDETLTPEGVLMIRTAAVAALLMALQGHTKAEVAEALWVKEPAVHNWARGRNGMTMDHAKFILSLYAPDQARKIQALIQ